MNRERALRTRDLAAAAGVHVNTVRFYEKIGFLSPVPRDPNGYRRFSSLHLLQVRVLRCIYSCGWLGRRIREASNQIIALLSQEKIPEALGAALEYRKLILREQIRAQATAGTLKLWAERTDRFQGSQCGDPPPFNLEQAAASVGVTSEILRNWERNGLIEIPRQGPNRRRVFTTTVMERLGIIYLLRQSRFSMSAILASLTEYDRGESPGLVREALDRGDQNREPIEESSWIWVGDRWIESLAAALVGADSILELIQNF